MTQLFINSEKAKDIAITLFEKINSVEGIFGHNDMPEDHLPIGIKKGSEEHLMFITLMVSLDYGFKDANILWRNGRNCFEDAKLRWVFYPEKVRDKSLDEIESVLVECDLGPFYKKNAGIIQGISLSLFEKYNSSPMTLIQESNYDARTIFEKKFDSRFKNSFKSLSGDKIFPLWIRMLHDNIELPLKNIDKIPIPVDVHIARATFSTGALTGNYGGTIPKIFHKIDETWERAIELVDHPKLKYRLQLDKPLWHLSKYGCTHREGNACPRKSTCPLSEFCVSGVVNVSPKKVFQIDTC